MDSSHLTSEETEAAELGPSVDLRERLSPKAFEGRQMQSPTKASRRRVSLSAPAWTLIGALALFTLTAALKGPKAAEISVLTNSEKESLLSPEVRPGPENYLATSHLQNALAAYRSIKGNDLTTVLVQTSDPMKMLGGPYTHEEAGFLRKTDLSSLVHDLSESSFETKFNPNERFVSDQVHLPQALFAYAHLKLKYGDGASAERALRTLFTLYPRLEESHGPSTWWISRTASLQAVKSAKLLMYSKASPELLQRLLDSTRTPAAFTAHEDAIRYAVAEELGMYLTDRAKLQEFLRSAKSPPKAALDPKATLLLANRMAISSLKDLQRPWAQRSAADNSELRRTLAEAWNFSEGTTGESDWLARMARRGQPIPKNLAGLMLLQAYQMILLDQPQMATSALADYQAARTILGIGVYKGRHGRFPRALKDLLVEGIFKELPRDPYNGQPFLYDPLHPRIWSTGPNGKSEGGPVPPNRSGDDDRVFPLSLP